MIRQGVDNVEPVLFLVVTAVACDARRDDDLAVLEIQVFAAVEQHDL